MAGKNRGKGKQRKSGTIPPCNNEPCEQTTGSIRPFWSNFNIISASKSRLNLSTDEAVPGTTEILNRDSMGREIRNRLVRSFREFVYAQSDCPGVHCYCDLSDEVSSVKYEEPINGIMYFDEETKFGSYFHKLSPGSEDDVRQQARDVREQILAGQVIPVVDGQPVLINPDVDKVVIENVNCCTNIGADYFFYSTFRYTVSYVARATLITRKGNCKYRSG